jgi:hypothetical protein
MRIDQLAQPAQESRLGERACGDVAGDPGVAAPNRDMARDRGHALQHPAVEIGHAALPLEHGKELGRDEQRVLVEAQPNQGLVEADLALRQAHHRLQMNFEPVFLDGGQDCGGPPELGVRRLIGDARRGGSRRCWRGRRHRDKLLARRRFGPAGGLRRRTRHP